MCAPPLSFGHVAIRMNNDILVIGCRRIDSNHIDISHHVIWVLNLHTERWRKHVISDHKKAPSSNMKACAVVIGAEIYMFGGYLISVNELGEAEDKDTMSYTNALWMLNRTSQEYFNWTEIEFGNGVKLPSPRGDHCGWEYARCLWVFGGFGPSSTEYLTDHGDFSNFNNKGWNNQLLCYDPSSHSWTNPQCCGAVPFPRSPSASAIIKDKV